jgi:hypothetical protein
MDKAVVTRRESREKGVKRRARGPVDDVDLADECKRVKKVKETQRLRANE